MLIDKPAMASFSSSNRHRFSRVISISTGLARPPFLGQANPPRIETLNRPISWLVGTALHMPFAVR